jgi:hypothetical protein
MTGYPVKDEVLEQGRSSSRDGSLHNNNTIEMSIGGKWYTVPALKINGQMIAIKGKWFKTALVHEEDYQEKEIQDPEECIRVLEEQKPTGLRADVFTFIQKLPSTQPKFSYAMEWDSIAAVCTTSFKDWWDQLPQEGRKNVKRASKRGVVVSVKPLDEQLIREIVDLNNDSPVRQGKPFVHYGKSVEQVRKDQAAFPDRSDYVCAHYESELIGFLKMAYREDIASIVQILPRESHHDKRPANALIAKAIEVCESKGLSFLTYGLFNYGNRSDSSLRQFKARNGFVEVLVPRFYVPLTWRGSVYVKMRLHRGLIGILPNSIMKLAVRARTKWYEIAITRSRRSSMAERSNCNRQTECSKPPAGSNI